MKKHPVVLLVCLLNTILVIAQDSLPELIPYRKGDLWGYCTPDKKIIIEPKYNDVYHFRNQLAIVKHNDKGAFKKKLPKFR